MNIISQDFYCTSAGFSRTSFFSVKYLDLYFVSSLVYCENIDFYFKSVRKTISMAIKIYCLM